MPGIKDKYQVSLKVFLENSAGEILIMKCAPTSKMGRAGFYDFPGGRIDEDEFRVPFSDIIRREVKEELGHVSVSIEDRPTAMGRHLITGDHPDVHVLQVFFQGKYLGGDINISEEHGGYEWVKLNEIDLEKYFISGILEAVKMYLEK